MATPAYFVKMNPSSSCPMVWSTVSSICVHSNRWLEPMRKLIVALYIGNCASGAELILISLPPQIYPFFLFFSLNLVFGFTPLPWSSSISVPSRELMKLLLLVLVVATALVGAQTTDGPDPVVNFCNMGGSSIAMSGEKAYIFGGWGWYDGFNRSYAGPNDILRVIDFSKSFRTGADVSEYVKLLELPDAVPRGSYVSLWPTTNNTLDLFHGFHETTEMQVLANDTAALKVWPLVAKHEFKITTETWTAKTVAEADLLMATIPEDKNGAVQKLATRTQVWVPGAKKGFELGGESYMDSTHTSWVDSRVFGSHSGLLVYDQETDSWTNETMPLNFMRNGVLAQLQTTDDTILIAFGGFTSDRFAPDKMRSMREFSIYSTNQARWFSFVAPEGGTVADTIARSCWTVASAQDNSSHQIITFGGAHTQEQVNSTKVWALTLPSFDWIELVGNATDPTRAPGERIDPACATVGNRYMLSWGGYGSACDNDGNAVFLLDISRGEWVDDYKVDQEYLVPDAVVAVIGGTGKGGATKRAPSGGFNDADLEKLLTFNTGAPETVGNSSSSNTGAIVGGVVGGLAAVAIAVGVFLFIRRRRQQRENAGNLAPQPAELETTHSVEGPKTPPHAQEYQPPVEMHTEPHADPPNSLGSPGRWEVQSGGTRPLPTTEVGRLAPAEGDAGSEGMGVQGALGAGRGEER